jgi:trans-aconitate 2-methyltransferase
MVFMTIADEGRDMGAERTHWNAEQYSTNSAVQFGITTSILDRHGFYGDESVVDLGCGDGKVTYNLSLRVPRGRAVGVDNSENMLQFARKTYATQHNLSFALRDVQQLGYDSEFDVAVSAFCIQWVPDKSAAFLAIRRSLRLGGKAILIMPFRNKTVAGLRKQMTQEGRWKQCFVNYIDPTDCLDDTLYEKYAQDAGLAVNSYTIETTVADFHNVPAFTEFLSALTPHLVRLSGIDEKRIFMEELVSRYLDIMPSARKGTNRATYVYDCAVMFADAN